MRRGRTTSFKGKDWQRLPYFGLNLCGSQSRAGLPRGRPAMFACSCGHSRASDPQKHFPHSPPYLSGSACRLGDKAGGSESRAIVLGLGGLKPAGPKTSMASCGPPRSEASARAPLRVAKAQPNPRPKALPRVSLTAAPLPLRRCRSALERWACLLLNVARWDFSSILLTAKQVKSLFKRAGDGFLRTTLFSRACAIHLYSAIAEIVESLL